jgi:hypothetical protein
MLWLMIVAEAGIPTAGLRRSFGGLVTDLSLRAHDCAGLIIAEGPPLVLGRAFIRLADVQPPACQRPSSTWTEPKSVAAKAKAKRPIIA